MFGENWLSVWGLHCVLDLHPFDASGTALPHPDHNTPEDVTSVTQEAKSLTVEKHEL